MRSSVQVIWALCLFSGPLVLLQPGCGPNRHPQARQLQGIWRVVAEADIQDEFASAAADDSKETKLAGQHRQNLRGIDRMVMAGEPMEIVFGPNAQLITRAKQEKRGIWKFESYDAQTATLVVTCQLGMEDPVETEITFVEPDLISLVPPNIAVLDKELLFSRAPRQ